MKGDFSRYTFDPKKHYNQVLMQQGRVQTDADWNEQQAIHQHRVQTLNKDIIGSCGVPEGTSGFKVASIGSFLFDINAIDNIQFVTPSQGWALLMLREELNSVLLSTVDGGENWQYRVSFSDQIIVGFYFIDEDNGWLTTSQIENNSSAIYSTEDSGYTWHQQVTRTGVTLVDLAFTSRENGWAVGVDTENNNGQILNTIDGGVNWTSQIITTQGLLNIHFITNLQGWALGSQQLLRTSDGGINWEFSELPTIVEGSFDLWGIYFISENLGYISGRRDGIDGQQGTLFTTKNGGRTWTEQTFPEVILDIFFVSNTHGWICGTGSISDRRDSAGVIYATTNGGENWQLQASGYKGFLQEIFFINESQGYVAGDQGIILATNNGGQTWSQQISPNDLLIFPGHIYVEGILCETEGFVISQQPNLPGSAVPQKPGFYIVYLDIWQRHLNYLDDPLMREVALGGPDTSTRLKTIWQVKLLLINSLNLDLNLKDLVRRLRGLIQENLELILSFGVDLSDLNKLLDKVSNNSMSSEELSELITGDDGIVPSLDNIISTLGNQSQPIPDELRILRQEFKDSLFSNNPQEPITCSSLIEEWENLIQPSSGKLNARSRKVEDTENPCLIPADAGYQRLENQLYRVEIHEGGVQGTATFKWSRDNGSVVSQITAINGGTEITVNDLGRDSTLGFKNGQWVEVIDDVLDLSSQPGHLALITAINSATRVISLSSGPSDIDLAQNPKLRRWDSKGDIIVNIPAENDGWIQLEGGVEIQFSEGSYNTGDYWLIPARTVTGEVEWPPYEIPNINPIPQSPLGIEHHYARLAILEVKDLGEDKRDHLLVDDCRCFFRPLGLQKAIHIVSINWQNDTSLSLRFLQREGLKIVFDESPLPSSISNDVFIVTLEVPLTAATSTNTTHNLVNNRISPDIILILDGRITVLNDLVTWKPIEDSLERALNFIDQSFQKDQTYFEILTRVTLKGHKIWSKTGPRLYLDGQVFGEPADDTEGIFRTGLIFPSGNEQRASDFESWFYLTSPIELSLSVNPGRVEAGRRSQGTVTLSRPAPIGGIIVGLDNDNSDIVTTPSNILIPQGLMSASFTIDTSRFLRTDLLGANAVNITATYDESSANADLEIVALPQIISLSINPPETTVRNIIIGVIGTVTLNKNALSSGARIELSASSETVILPSLILIPSGEDSASFPISTREILSIDYPEVVSVNARFNSSRASSRLSVDVLI